MSGRRLPEARKHLAALERLERIIAAFASMVSHETRSALVGIQGLSELIRDGDWREEEVRAYAGEIFGEATKIDALIGEMFDLNRLETGETAFRRVKLDLNRTIEDAAGRLLDGRPQLTVDLELAAGPVTVVGDPDRLQQAMRKTFGFVKRTALPDSHITITTRRRETAAGVDIRSSASKAVDLADWLYGRYERYEYRPSAILGAGLGLAIARAIIDLHGGRIEAVPAEPCGAELRITLPALAGSDAGPGPERAPTPSR